MEAENVRRVHKELNKISMMLQVGAKQFFYRYKITMTHLESAHNAWWLKLPLHFLVSLLIFGCEGSMGN